MRIIRHDITDSNPPFNHYFEMRVSNVRVVENRDFNCLTISADNDYDDDMVHICDVGEVIEALKAFQEMRAEDPRYVKEVT